MVDCPNCLGLSPMTLEDSDSDSDSDSGATERNHSGHDRTVRVRTGQCGEKQWATGPNRMGQSSYKSTRADRKHNGTRHAGTM